MANQVQTPFIDLRTIYEVREKPSRIYNWSSFITAHLLVEIPWDLFSSLLLFICWYWAVGFPTDRAGYSYLMLGIAYPLYYTTIGLAVASAVSTAEVAALSFSILFSFVLIL